MHRHGCAMDVVTVRLPVGSDDYVIRMLVEIVFPPLFESRRQEFSQSVNGENPCVGKIIRRCKMKKCHRLKTDYGCKGRSLLCKIFAHFGIIEYI